MFVERVFKWLAISIATLVMGAIAALFIYDLFVFLPHRPEIDALLAAAPPHERAPPAMLPLLQEADEGDWRALQATQLIVREVDRSRQLRTLQRAARDCIWHLLLKFHYTYPQLLQIERSGAFFGPRVTGFEAGAISVFNRPLVELDDLELAQLVVITRWPSHFLKPENAKRRESAARALLTRASRIDAARTAR